jgi:hypothetical protein
MKYEVGAPFFSEPYLGLALTWMTSLGLPVAQNRAQIFSGGDGAPSADGVEADGHRALGQQ